MNPGEQTEELLKAIAHVHQIERQPTLNLMDHLFTLVLLYELARDYRTYVEHIARIIGY